MWKLFSSAKFKDFSAVDGPCTDGLKSVAVLRGLCLKSRLDVLYMPIAQEGRPLSNIWQIKWTGVLSSELIIVWIAHEDHWKLKGKDTTAISTDDYKSYPLGRHNWMITNDTCKYGKMAYTTTLKLSHCSEDEFTCWDGDCVKMDRRCDRVPNCKDRSDEKGCQIVVLDQGYRKDFSPIQPILDMRDVKASLLRSLSYSTQGQNKTLVPLDVEVEINDVKVVSMEMDEAQHYITFQFKILLRWRDQRLTFHNLKHDNSLNALDRNETEQIWLPLVIYDNTDDKDTTRLGLQWEQWSTLVEVQREGNFTRSGYDQVDEAEIFSGSENTLRMKQTYKRKFQCQYVLDRYPFDVQVIL